MKRTIRWALRGGLLAGLALGASACIVEPAYGPGYYPAPAAAVVVTPGYYHYGYYGGYHRYYYGRPYDR